MEKYIKKLVKTMMFLTIVLLLTNSTIEAQKITKPTSKQLEMQPTFKSLVWMDETAGVEIYLIGENAAKRDFNLLVVSEKEVKVIYRTSRNSRQPVVKELTPVKSKNGRSYFNVLHSFSRTTIWMALDFMVEGKKVDSLTRTFYDSMFEIVPNEQFLKE